MRSSIVFGVMLGLWCATLHGATHTEAAGSAFHQRIERRHHETDIAHARRVAVEFDRIFAPVPVARLPNMRAEELEARFEATYVATSYEHSSRHLPALLAMHDELFARGKGRGALSADVFRMLLLTRELSQAERFHRERFAPDMGPMPTLHDGVTRRNGRPTVWRVAASSLEAHRETLPRVERRIVVVSHPLCGFTRNAVRPIAADRQLSTVFREHAVWLTPADGLSSLGAIQAWNRDHPEQEMRIAHRRDEWRAIDSWATPTFYFFEGDELRSKIVGWPAASQLDALREAAHKAGLLAPTGRDAALSRPGS